MTSNQTSASEPEEPQAQEHSSSELIQNQTSIHHDFHSQASSSSSSSSSLISQNDPASSNDINLNFDNANQGMVQILKAIQFNHQSHHQPNPTTSTSSQLHSPLNHKNSFISHPSITTSSSSHSDHLQSSQISQTHHHHPTNPTNPPSPSKQSTQCKLISLISFQSILTFLSHYSFS
ncbi:hypothetical protein DFH28DRAFT_235755 [Melampsora americana]|nr:hypothetical protein DFH28DRAFT_235755 [Melampsora americana]